jgi:hypothetical protein
LGFGFTARLFFINFTLIVYYNPISTYMRIRLLILFLFFTLAGAAQNARTDSLLTQLDKAKDDKEKVKILMALSSGYAQTNLYKALDYTDQAWP